MASLSYIGQVGLNLPQTPSVSINLFMMEAVITHDIAYWLYSRLVCDRSLNEQGLLRENLAHDLLY